MNNQENPSTQEQFIPKTHTQFLTEACHTYGQPVLATLASLIMALQASGATAQETQNIANQIIENAPTDTFNIDHIEGEAYPGQPLNIITVGVVQPYSLGTIKVEGQAPEQIPITANYIGQLEFSAIYTSPGDSTIQFFSIEDSQTPLAQKDLVIYQACEIVTEAPQQIIVGQETDLKMYINRFVTQSGVEIVPNQVTAQLSIIENATRLEQGMLFEPESNTPNTSSQAHFLITLDSPGTYTFIQLAKEAHGEPLTYCNVQLQIEAMKNPNLNKHTFLPLIRS